jgi:hypothetical protein
MHISTLLSALVAAGFASTSPTPRDISYGVSLVAVTSPGTEPNKVTSPIPIEINKLSQIYGDNNQGLSVSELIIQPGTAYNVDEDAIECRAYKDFAGVLPGSAAFTVSKPALISTNLATVGSILCYIVPLPSA